MTNVKLVMGLALCLITGAAHADSGTVLFRCDGDLQVNDDPHGEDKSIHYFKAGVLVSVDYDTKEIRFSDWEPQTISSSLWSVAGIEEADSKHVYASWNMDAPTRLSTDSDWEQVMIDMTKGTVTARRSHHSAATKMLWPRRVFFGNCRRI